ncbi:sigma-54-dependent transcriptional regulator [Bacteroidota bacterium]
MELTDAKILIVDDDRDILVSAKMFMDQHFSLVRTETDPDKLIQLVNKDNFDIILLDMNFEKGETGGKEGIKYLKAIIEERPDSVVILMTAFGDIDLAINGIKEGAFDFILKPWKNAKLLASILSAIKLRESNKQVEKLKNTQIALSKDIDKNFSEIIGNSSPIRKVKETIDKIANTDTNILVLGENGTGKELVAREIHRNSHRSENVFISVDMGAIHESLFESEIFGHIKGSFTDAKSDKTGRFELASGGTIFLDEIANLSYSLQAKLLTVLERRTVCRIGSATEIPVDVRLICATNMPLKEMVKEGNFRQDLLYRINTFEIYVPTLRERVEDIPILTNHFLKINTSKYNKPRLTIPKKTLKLLQNHTWPGNIRELQNSVERAVVLCDEKEINIDHFFVDYMEHTTRLPDDSLKLNEMEKILIKKAIKKHMGNITKASRELGIDRNALYRRLNKYGI